MLQDGFPSPVSQNGSPEDTSDLQISKANHCFLILIPDFSKESETLDYPRCHEILSHMNLPVFSLLALSSLLLFLKKRHLRSVFYPMAL